MANKEQNSEFAKWMKKHPNQYPDSISKGGHRGVGTADRERGKGINPGPNGNSKWMAGVFGGILAHKLSFPLPDKFAHFL